MTDKSQESASRTSRQLMMLAVSFFLGAALIDTGIALADDDKPDCAEELANRYRNKEFWFGQSQRVTDCVNAVAFSLGRDFAYAIKCNYDARLRGEIQQEWRRLQMAYSERLEYKDLRIAILSHAIGIEEGNKGSMNWRQCRDYKIAIKFGLDTVRTFIKILNSR